MGVGGLGGLGGFKNWIGGGGGGYMLSGGGVAKFPHLYSDFYRCGNFHLRSDIDCVDFFLMITILYTARRKIERGGKFLKVVVYRPLEFSDDFWMM